jgi:hypothetical protein
MKMRRIGHQNLQPVVHLSRYRRQTSYRVCVQIDGAQLVGLQIYGVRVYLTRSHFQKRGAYRL